MAEIFTMTAPLSVRLPTGEQQVVAELVPIEANAQSPKLRTGLVWFSLYWHLGEPGHGMHWLEGTIQGQGPWKIADHIFNVLGCHGSNHQLASAHAAWNDYQQRADNDYPPRPLIEAIARHFVEHVLPT